VWAYTELCTPAQEIERGSLSHPVSTLEWMRLDKALLDLAAEQQSCFADWQVRALGASRTELSRLRRSAQWQELGPHVLVLAGVRVAELVLASAAVLEAGPNAVLSHASSVALWGVPGFRLLPAMVAQVNGRAMRERPLGRLRNLVVVPERWVTSHRGIRVVRPELAAYQMCGEISPQRAARLFDRMWSLRLLSGRSARACLEDLEKRGRDGTVVYREIIKERGDSYVPPASNLESRVKELAADAGMRLRRQVDLGGEHWDGRVDFFEDDVKLVVEVQSERHHTALVDVEADADRRARLEAAGFTFLEIWDADVWSNPGMVVARMQRAATTAKSCVSAHKIVYADTGFASEH